MRNTLLHLTSIILLFSIGWSAFSSAFSEQETTDENIEYLDDWVPIKVTGDAISWDIFATTKEIEECKIQIEYGTEIDVCIVKPEYSKEVLELDKKEAVLMGYMFPLTSEEELRNFILIPYPLTCPFHYHSTPSQTIEILSKEPIKLSLEPVTLKGIFSTNYNNETGMFYYLNNAELY